MSTEGGRWSKKNLVNVVCERPPGGLKTIKNHLGSNFVKSSKVPYSTDEKLEVQFFFVTKPDETIGYNNRGLKLLVMKKKTK